MKTRGDENKFDREKPMWDLLPYREVGQIVDVLTYGAAKYSPYNWMQMKDPHARCFAALMRHMTAWKSGEIMDKESGLPHLAHAGCCLLFLMHFDNKGVPCPVLSVPAGSLLHRSGAIVEIRK